MNKQPSPILGVKVLPNDEGMLKVYGGLHYIRVNKLPHFSITGRVIERGRETSCGCLHDLILSHFPEFADIIALHLSDIKGVPLHAKENGWYYLTGALPDKADAKFYPECDPNKCLSMLAAHLRIKLSDAAWLKQNIIESAFRGIEKRLHAADAGFAVAGVRSPIKLYDWMNARQSFDIYVESLKPSWEQEAAACIARHDLKVFGDEWKGF